ncbi:ABC transporter substrate-binding protein [Desulfotignum phosphitoxidans]|jgi:putative ABC transport system substrate-binding protein|uniref:ABC-type transport system, periplasmic component-like protein n=1 Tax=Desulfotignum phosphitoxidans DSM 13687 TaxID=1286635 RepID=S0FZ45_9BACT|nr:ABC transporter substrate binding protein [Desulfotignum phosphitoxidans]EMS79940.1 ABC-type transport system, periplasmic component-like protein [Desulfotignum phosphitoxidans DSM 13687]
MNRRACKINIWILVTAGILCWLLMPFYAAARDVRQVVVVVTMQLPACETHLTHFVDRLEQIGEQSGIDIDLITIRANGDRQFAENQLKKILKKGRPDVVATIATLASQAAVTVFKDTGVPIFFFQVSDPVGAGLIQKIGEPTGTNVTGRVFTVPAKVRTDLIMRLVTQTVPPDRPVVFGYIHSTYPSAMGDIRQLKTIAAQENHFRFAVHDVMYEKGPDGMPVMLAAAAKGVQTLSDRVDFWWEPQGPLGEHPDYTRLLLERSTVPVAMGQTMDSVKMGALLHITPDLEAGGREAANFVAAFLKGADPGTIPVTAPARFQLGINLTTALNLNIVVPPDILALAGNHVYR